MTGTKTLVICPEGKTGTVTIPNSVTSIGWSAFAGCVGLTSVAIPNSVTSIEARAFAKCSGLSSVSVEWNTPLAISPMVFDSVNVETVRLNVLAGTEDSYLSAPVWQDFNQANQGIEIYTITYIDIDGATIT